MLPWFERNLKFGYAPEMLPYFLERLSGTVLRLEYKVKGVSEEILSAKPDGKWSVKETIGHLAEVDTIANKRIDEMTAGVEMLSPAVFEPKDYNPWPIEKIVNQFRTNRNLNIEKYKSLTKEDLAKSSIHPRLKVPMTPVDLAWFDAEHDDHHLVGIQELIDRLKKESR
jgi:hypothetical protein